MKKLITLAAWALLFAVQPASAQIRTGVVGNGPAVETEQGIADPLTPEQEARLPAAYELYDTMMPDGFYGQLMASVTGVDDEPIEADPAMAFWETFGTSPDDMVGDEAAIVAALDIADPAWRDRQIIPRQRMRDQFVQMGAIMDPLMRDAMAESYAIYYNDAELAEVSAFLATPAGAKFLGQPSVMQAQPRMTAERAAEMEAAQERIAAMNNEGMNEVPEFPARRGFSELSDAERQQLASLLGIDQTALEELMGNVWGMAAEAEWDWEEDDTYEAAEPMDEAAE